MATINRDVFTHLGFDKTKNEQKIVNIIFVHGLKGHPKYTWGGDKLKDNRVEPAMNVSKGFLSLFRRSQQNSPSASSEHAEAPSGTPFWPEEFLAADIPEARIWTYGYDASVVEGFLKSNNQNSITRHGNDFSVRFDRDIDNKDPVIFVAHSLGGIIVKDAIRRSPECQYRTKLVVFLGTPHRGSAYASWGKMASNIARLAKVESHKKIIQALEVENEVLDIIHEEFVRIVDQYRFKIHSFYEGDKPSGIKGINGKIVSDFSSKIGLPSTLETVQRIDADHRQMVKCTSRDDPRYHSISSILKNFVRGGELDVLSTTHANAPTPAQIQLVPEENGQEAPLREQRYFHVPRLKNPRFTGRAKTLEQLREMLFTHNHENVALVGLGGIGKTQVALQLAYWVKSCLPEYSIFWVSALSNASFEQAYIGIMKECAIEEDDEDPKQLVQEYLGSHKSGKWLLIIDNADDKSILFGSPGESSIADYLPVNSEGRILYTTRARGVAVSVSGNHFVELGEMSAEEGKDYLEKSLFQKEDLENQEDVTEFLEHLAFLPLAITQAVAYMNENQVAIEEYLQLFKSTDQDMIELLSSEFEDNTRYKHSQNAVATTWLISFQQIRKTNEGATLLLSFIGCIEPKAIPKSMLPKTGSEQKLRRSIGVLMEYSFLSRHKNADMYEMHSLVHMATRLWIEQQGNMEKAKQDAIVHLESVAPETAWETRHLRRLYSPHVLSLLNACENITSEERCALGRWVGYCLQVDGNLQEAMKEFEKVVAIERDTLEEHHTDRLRSQFDLAAAYRDNGKVEEAIQLFKYLVAIEEDILAEDDPNRLGSQQQLANAYQDNGQIEEAINILQHVAIIEERTLGKDAFELLNTQEDLASAYQANGQITEAIELLERLIPRQAKILPETHPGRLSAQFLLVSVYRANGQAEEADQLLERLKPASKVLAEE